jgi:hypothetical protein
MDIFTAMGLPALPTVNGIPMIDDRPDTTRDDTEAAKEAWETAIAAIDAAWKITPSHMLRTRMVVRRGEFNQGLALYAAHAMRQAANDALNSMGINERARRDGLSWAAPTDADAVARS